MPCARCSRGEISQKKQLSGSLPSWSGSLVSHRKTSRDLEEYTMSGRLRPHTHSEQDIHSCSTIQESSREKLFKIVRGASRLWSALAESLCYLGGWSVKRTGPELRSAVRGPHRDSFKRGPRPDSRLNRDPVLAHAHAAALLTTKPEGKHSAVPLSPAAREEQRVLC